MDKVERVLPGETRKASNNNAVDREGLGRVLAVDDEQAACKLLSIFLSAQGFHCAAVHSGEEALAALQDGAFDAVISDLHMPGLGGIKLLCEVRRRYPHIAFLVTTGVDDIEVGVKAMRQGADDYLVKPLEPLAVAASLERALQKHRLELEVAEYRQHLEKMVVERTTQLTTALRQLECSYEDTLQALGVAIDLRDSETAGHSLRVCRYSLEIACRMGWSEQSLGSLARGAYLHDIGKLGVPDGVLLKPGPLTAEERALMQQHAQIGFDIVKGITFLADAAEIVLAHHERYDGKGYPRGLKGCEIPAGARIFSLADTLDAITSDRPYRAATSFASATETIRHLSGNQLDPEVVAAFLSVPAETWLIISRHQRQILGIPKRLGRNLAHPRFRQSLGVRNPA